MNKFRLLAVLAVIFVSSVLGATTNYTSYALLKEIDVPEYNEWRFGLGLETYTYENFGWGDTSSPQIYSWHETTYSLSLEWGFWTFPMGDLSLGVELPFYFWYAKDDLKTAAAPVGNENISGAVTKVTGLMDPEIFADYKFGITDHISGLVHAGFLMPGFAEKADEGGAALGVMRMTFMGGIIIEYNRFIIKLLGGIETGSTPDVTTSYRTPALLVPQVSEWENSTVMLIDIDMIFCATATTGFGIQYLYKGAYFDGGDWSGGAKPTQNLPGEPDPLGMLVLKLYFANTAGGLYSSEKGTIFTVGIGMGGIGADADLNPDILYEFTLSKYF